MMLRWTQTTENPVMLVACPTGSTPRRSRWSRIGSLYDWAAVSILASESCIHFASPPSFAFILARTSLTYIGIMSIRYGELPIGSVQLLDGSIRMFSTGRSSMHGVSMPLALLYFQ